MKEDGKMPAWEKYAIGDLCSSVSETYRGADPEVVLINTSDILEGQVLNHQKVENKKLKGQFKKTFQKDDILFSEIRPANKRYAYIDFEDTSLYIASTKLMVLRPRQELVNPKYLYALLKSDDIISHLQQLAESRSGTFPQITFSSELAPMEVFLPDKSIQDKIVMCLEMLEDKVLLNSRFISNLDLQMKTIFRHLFIDNPENEKWRLGCFADLILNTIGGDWGKETATGNYKEKVYCMRGADIPEVKIGNKGKMPVRYILTKNYASKKLLAGDIVVEISGGSPTQSTGRVAAISDSLLKRYDEKMICTNFCRAMKPRSGYSMFVYYYWQYLYDSNVFFGYENGTTGIKNLDINGFLSNEKIVIPPEELVFEFSEIAGKAFDQIFALGAENEHILTIRDTLMPQLLSGEWDISNVELINWRSTR